MKLTLACLNGNWILSRADMPGRAKVIRDEQEGVQQLLAYLGLATRDMQSGRVKLEAGEYEL